ncbi:MAG: protein IsiD [Microcoleaceae cyanobacterium]
METVTLSSSNISNLTEAEITQLAKRLEQDEYTNPFEGLQDWHLLRAIAFQRPELVESYLYLLDIESYDEA